MSKEYPRRVQRFEDMSPRGSLCLVLQEDGDIVVVVYEDVNSQGLCAGIPASVEFCTNGGKSHKTLEALRHLAMAMQEENLTTPQWQTQEAAK